MENVLSRAIALLTCFLLTTVTLRADEVRRDFFGDPLPERAIARLGTTRLRHGHSVFCLAFSPDGKRLASGGNDFAATVWDVATGKELLSIIPPTGRDALDRPGRTVNAVAFSLDGKILAVARASEAIRLHDSTTGKELGKLPAQSMVQALAFSPDGKLLASREATLILLWDAATGKIVRDLSAGGRAAAHPAVAFSPDGKTLAAAIVNGVQLWDVATGEAKATLHAPRNAICHGLAFSPDGKQVWGSGFRTLYAWDANTGVSVRATLVTDPVFPKTLLSPDGKRAAGVLHDGTIRLFDVATGKPSAEWDGPAEAPTALAFSPDGKRLALGGEKGFIGLWDTENKREAVALAGHRGGAWAVTFAPDGRSVLSAGDDETVRVWDAVSGKALRQFRAHQGARNGLAFSEDGKAAATVATDVRLRVWDTSREKVLRRPDYDPTASSASVALSPDGKRLAVSTTRGEIRLLGADGAEQGRLKGAATPARFLAFSPDGTRLASAHDDGRLRLWDVAAAKEARTLDTDGASVLTFAFAPDGKTLAAGDTEGAAHVWDLDTGEPVARVARVAGNASGYVMAVAFSPDGRALATGSWTAVSVWEVATGKERLRLHGHRGDVGALAFSRDGRRLVTGSSDNTLLIWDLTGRAPDGTLRASELAEKDVETAWADLLDEDAAKAHRAVWTLAASPSRAVPFLAGHVKPDTPPDARKVARLVAQLDDDELEARDRATTALQEIGGGAEAALRKVLQAPPSLEADMRARELLKRSKSGWAAPPDVRRGLRALEVLEQAASPEARRALEALAGGPEGSRLAGAARAALGRALAARREGDFPRSP